MSKTSPQGMKPVVDSSDPSLHLRVLFDQGLGDCANFAHVLELYRRRGYKIDLHCADDKAIVFSPSGATRVPASDPNLIKAVLSKSSMNSPGADQGLALFDRSGSNFFGCGLPSLGSADALWKELCEIRLNISPHIGGNERRQVSDFLRDLPRPIILVHTMGNNFADAKNIEATAALELYIQLLDKTDGSLVLLDWDDRAQRLNNWRVRHLTDDWRWIDVSTLVALMEQSDLLVGVDSGPLHLARLTDIPAIGVFPTLTAYPARLPLPRGRTVSVVPKNSAYDDARHMRLTFNVVAGSSTSGCDPDQITTIATRMLAGPRYLRKEQLAGDIQLQQFVLDWERGGRNFLNDYTDRHRGYDCLLREMSARFANPAIVETGCIRGHEDWSGAGFGTYLLGAYAHRKGGEVISVDNNSENCAFARLMTTEAGTVTVVHQDSVAFLKDFGRLIDVLLLDSMDTDHAGHEEHALREIQAAYQYLHSRSIVILDDTIYDKRKFVGKGALAVPWLLDSGWRILFSGYQTICVRSRSEVPRQFVS